MTNQVAPITTSSGYTYPYSSDSEDEPVFKEIVRTYKTVNSINTYSVVTQHIPLAITPTKVLKKQRKTRVRTQIATIKQAKSDTTASARFLFTAIHSVSRDITRSHTDKIL